MVILNTYIQSGEVGGSHKTIPDPVESSNSCDPRSVFSFILKERKNVEGSVVGHETRASELKDVVNDLKIYVIIVKLLKTYELTIRPNY